MEHDGLLHLAHHGQVFVGDGVAECFIVNAAECEPLIETDKYLCRTFPEEVVAAAAARRSGPGGR